MFKSEPSPPATSVAWLVAVLGAAAVLLSPITPWVVPVELAGGIICVVASGVLAAAFFRH
jgi:hypothetical protein